MAKITVNRENFQVDERELEQGSLTIGRNQDNDLSIDDPAVSGHHAQIVTVFDSSYIEDLGSTNGTFVNGKQAKTHTLHNGDVLTMGHYQILFQSETAAIAQNANATMMIGASQLEELTTKAKQKDRRKTPARKSPSATPPRNSRRTPAVAATPPPASKPRLEAHENGKQPSPSGTELPDIDDNENILGETQPAPSTPPLYNRRKGDNSILPPLKVISLAVLVTVITFTLLMLIFK
ncbi:MAG: FHA domain-containing protein [Gammaproteobacteria bacterium]|nr:FHA domain-containing protein [Gammaproteobacteria bacterium]